MPKDNFTEAECKIFDYFLEEVGREEITYESGAVPHSSPGAPPSTALWGWRGRSHRLHLYTSWKTVDMLALYAEYTIFMPVIFKLNVKHTFWVFI